MKGKIRGEVKDEEVGLHDVTIPRASNQKGHIRTVESIS
jgi:hypothetical protein